MPRLGSNFFNAYNDQVDNLRRRRSENVDSFNSFVKMRTELGETASVAEMEKMRNALAGGDGYFMNALPTSTMLAETELRLKENQADERAKERSQVLSNTGKSISNRTGTLANQESEFQFARTIAAGLTNVDINTPEGKAALAKAYEEAGQSQLLEKFGAMVPNMHESARLTQQQQWIDANGFDSLTTTEGFESALGQAPTWMKTALKKRGENTVKTAQTARIDKAKTEVIDNFSDYLTKAGGDPMAIENLVKGELKYKLGDLYNETIFRDLMTLADGQIQLDQSSRMDTAQSKLAATEDELLAVQGNPEALRNLARTKLMQGGAFNPSTADIDAAVKTLQSQQKVAARSDFEDRLDTAAQQAAAIDREDLEQLTSTRKIEERVDAILRGVYPDYDSLTESEKTEAIARVTAIINPAAKSAVNIEAQADDQAVLAAIVTDERIKVLTKNGPSKEKRGSIYTRINTLRRSVGLPQMSDAQIEATYGDQIDAAMNVGASERFVTKSAEVRSDVVAVVADLKKDHNATMETIAGQVGEEWAGVAQQAQLNYIPRSRGSYQAFTNYILNLQEQGVKPPENPAEASVMAMQIAKESNWLPYGSAQQILIAEGLSDLDLIEPDTLLSDHLASEDALITSDVSVVVAQVTNQPRNKVEDVRSLVDQSLEIIDDWEEAAIRDLKSPDIVPLINGLDSSTFPTAEAQVKGMATILRQSIQNAKPSGQYSFLSHFPGDDGSLFYVSADAKDAEDIRAANASMNGLSVPFEPGATYRQIAPPGGGLPTYEKVMAPTVIVDGQQPNNAGTQGGTSTQVDPNAAPVVQDVQTQMASAEITKRLRQEADDIVLGRDGYAGTNMAGQAMNYFFGSSNTEAQVAQRTIDSKVANFLRSDTAILYLRANPSTIDLMESDPYTWAAQAGMR